MKALVTGAAGFIGSHLCERLLSQRWIVTGVDNFDDFYDPQIKRRNIDGCNKNKNFKLIEADIRDIAAMDKAIDSDIEVIVHLAAKAGVRPSIAQPVLYADVNVNGTTVLLEAAKKHEVSKFIFGSSSSVYGNNRKVPFSESDSVDFPISPYAATKKAGELICHTYHHLYGINVICLRYFTVYGPRQRPDLAIHKFAKLIEQRKTIPIYGDGTMMRDFTYIDDIIDGTVSAMQQLTAENAERAEKELIKKNSAISACSAVKRTRCAGFNIYNLGHSHPITVNDLIAEIEKALGKKAIKEYLPSQPGDVERTYADVTKASGELNFNPATSIETGLARFVEWLHKH